MSFQQKRNAGFYGLVDIKNDGVAGATGNIAFTCLVKQFGGGIQYAPINRAGYNVTASSYTGTPVYRLGQGVAQGEGSGQTQNGFPPIPIGIEYNNGTITQQQDTNAKIDIPVRIFDVTWTRPPSDKADNWNYSFKWIQNGDISLTWNGTRVTFSRPTANDRETWDGMSKTFDDNFLVNGATQRIDCESIDNTSAADEAKIVALFSAGVAPMANLKLRTVTCGRSDKNGIQASLVWGMTDTADDVLMPRYSITTDPNQLQDVQTSALFWTSNGTVAPSTPATPSGFKLVRYQDGQLNDITKVRMYTWARLDSKDEIELPPTVSVRSFVGPNTDTTVSLLSTTDSAATIANANEASFMAEQYAVSLSAQKPNPIKGILVKNYVNPGIMVIGRSFADPNPQIAYYDYGDAVVKAYIGSAKGFDGTNDWYIMTSGILTNWVREFSLVRWFAAGTTIPEFNSLADTVNNATFLGIPAGQCYFLGPEYSVKVGSPNSGPFLMSYRFTSKSLGIFTLTGWQPELIYASGLSVGWNDVADLGFSGDIPASGDFSPFLA